MHLPLYLPFTFIAVFLMPLTLQGAPFVPKDDAVIATSNIKLKASLSVEEIKNLLDNSQFSGQSERLQGALKTHLVKLYQENPTSEVSYLYARILQKEHLFEQAINIAKEAIDDDPNHVNSHLLLANIFMTQGRFEAATKHCISLIGLVSTLTASTCVLDIQSQHKNVQQSYQSLLKIVDNKETNLATKHVLSEMSYRMGHYKKALSHINHIKLSNMPVSLVVLWADIQLRLNNSEHIINSLSTLVDDNTNLEDALLLRLAIAEKDLKTHGQKWQKMMAERVSLREIRQDTFHASELAKYYINIQPNTDKALYWANINWQQAKMSMDQQLLKDAQTMPRGKL
ncbi:tetratricopeptide repeat protein [Pseudoalteromonas sp. US3C1013]|uniref:tetratricopeptide repeat protein n=1 Tax=unclassified Pseudoalteromonas TaxID=194690 RepID=UPI003AB73922